ncbi:hypothetical protein AB6A40_010899 [Gnathostoma spinigerum]|uniref:Uncharacterized protein n=1 Tax=Gnathostoma spinigerum TaxID=75299 RepID=A0ABD6EXK9_9BILA
MRIISDDRKLPVMWFGVRYEEIIIAYCKRIVQINNAGGPTSDETSWDTRKQHETVLRPRARTFAELPNPLFGTVSRARLRESVTEEIRHTMYRLL